jgi:hypothetical protein
MKFEYSSTHIFREVSFSTQDCKAFVTISNAEIHEASVTISPQNAKIGWYLNTRGTHVKLVNLANFAWQLILQRGRGLIQKEPINGLAFFANFTQLKGMYYF